MTTERVLTHTQARRFYDRFGGRQDSQGFYERPALQELVRHLELDKARAVVEFGCGTGHFAAELLREQLAPDATYLGLDVSGAMVDLARERLASFAARAEVRQTDGSPGLDVPETRFDRFLSTFVLDLLSPEDVRAVLGEARRVLQPDGLLGLVSLTRGERGLARVVSAAWKRLHRLHPTLVGGCRPIEITSLLPPEEWKVCYRSVVSAYAIASEIVVAAPRPRR